MITALFRNTQHDNTDAVQQQCHIEKAACNYYTNSHSLTTTNS